MLLRLSLAASLSASLYGQVKSLPSPAPSAAGSPRTQSGTANASGADEEPEQQINPSIALQPAWMVSTDSDGNIRQWLKLDGSLAVGSHGRLGLLFGQGFISNSIWRGNPQEIRDAELTWQWNPSEVVKLEGMLGVSQASATINADEQPVGPALIPITKLQFHFTPAEKIFKLDLGFDRSIYDLSPQLVANRVVRNQFAVHPELALTNGWRVRGLAEIGPMTRPGESNARYNFQPYGKARRWSSTYEAW